MYASLVSKIDFYKLKIINDLIYKISLLNYSYAPLLTIAFLVLVACSCHYLANSTLVVLHFEK